MIAEGRLKTCDVCGCTEFQERKPFQFYEDDKWDTDTKGRNLCPRCVKAFNRVWDDWIKHHFIKRK